MPHDAVFSLYELDWDVFGVHIAGAINRCPVLEPTGIKSTVCGPESFTPDHKPLMGRYPRLDLLPHFNLNRQKKIGSNWFSSSNHTVSFSTQIEQRKTFDKKNTSMIMCPVKQRWFLVKVGPKNVSSF